MIYSSCPIFWLYVVSQTHFVRMIMLAILFFSCYYWLSFFFFHFTIFICSNYLNASFSYSRTNRKGNSFICPLFLNLIFSFSFFGWRSCFIGLKIVLCFFFPRVLQIQLNIYVSKISSSDSNFVKTLYDIFTWYSTNERWHLILES